MSKAWVCTDAECRFNIRIVNREISFTGAIVRSDT